jgi:hypothetical protein
MSQPDFEKRKADTISGLRDARERILALAAILKHDQRDEIYLGTWSAREVLAHLAGWLETNVQATNEILAGEVPSFYEYADKDWASYNALLVSKYALDDFEELLLVFRETHNRFLGIVEGIPATDLWMDRGIHTRGSKVTIGRLLEAELQDEEEHYLQLRQFIESGVKS